MLNLEINIYCKYVETLIHIPLNIYTDKKQFQESLTGSLPKEGYHENCSQFIIN